MTLSPTQAAILSAAARHPERLAAPPPKLAPAPRDAVRKSLLARGLIAPTAEAIDPTTAWTADATLVNYRITEAGLRAVGAETAAGADASDSAPSEATEAVDAPEAVCTAVSSLRRPRRPCRCPLRPRLRYGRRAPSAAPRRRCSPLGTMRRAAAPGRPTPWPPCVPCSRASRPAPRATPPAPASHAKVPTSARRCSPCCTGRRARPGRRLSRRPGWAPHTVRGFLAALKRRSVAVLVHDRVRQAGPGKEGAKGSHSIYRIAEAG